MDRIGCSHRTIPDLAISARFGEERLKNDILISANPAEPVLFAKNIQKKFGRRKVLKSADLQINRGECIVLTGENGVGKSTLIKILSGTLKADASDSLIICGKVFSDNPGQKRKIGLISHQPMLYNDLSAFENLLFFAEIYAVPQAQDRINSLLQRMGLELRKDDPVRTYSRGMQQRTSICRALLHDPELLLMDEPFTGLDEKSIRILEEIIGEAKNSQKAILVTTHTPAAMTNLATRFLKLEKGLLQDEKL